MYNPKTIFMNDSAQFAYVQALIASIIKASGCEIELIESTDSNNYFIRDHFIITGLDDIAITSQKTKDIQTIIKKMAPILPETMSTVAIKSEFFGGNTFQIVHGQTNTVYFAHDGARLMSSGSFFRPEQFDPTVMIDELNLYKEENPASFARTQFKALSIQTKEKEHRDIWEHYYYHLDCFMLFVPNGKVILLNKKMLKEASYKELERQVGTENLIDLEHDYLGNPVLFNMVVIPLPNNRHLLLGPSLPQPLIDKLESLGYYVITPESLKSTHPRFNESLAKQVNRYLHEAGWQSDKDQLISQTIPEFHHDFSLKNFRFLVHMLTSVKNAIILLKIVTGVLDFPLMDFHPTKSERLLFIQLLGQFIPAFGGTKSFLNGASEKEKIKYYLQILCACDHEIDFDFAQFDSCANIPENIHFISRARNGDEISFVSNKGSVHCMLQECPMPVDGKMQLYSAATPLFNPISHHELSRRYQGADLHPPGLDLILRRAAARGNITDIGIALEAGAHINSQDERRGYTALHWACLNGHRDVIQFLIQKGADPTITSNPANPQHPFDLTSIDLSDIEYPVNDTSPTHRSLR